MSVADSINSRYDRRDAIHAAVAAGSYGPAARVECRTCGAWPGSPCTAFGTLLDVLEHPHRTRVADGEAWATRVVPAAPVRLPARVFEPGDPLGVACPVCDAAEGLSCDPWDAGERCHAARHRLANRVQVSRARVTRKAA